VRVPANLPYTEQTGTAKHIVLQVLTGCSALQGSAHDPYEEPEEIFPDWVRLAVSGMSSEAYERSVTLSVIAANVGALD
jgi:hypothetical protein